MKNLKYIFALITSISLIAAAFVSCKKSSNQLQIYTVTGIIRNTGSPVVDGCGWLLLADSAYYPTNLDTKYQMDSLKVTVTFFKPGDRTYCGSLARPQNKGISNVLINTITVNK